MNDDLTSGRGIDELLREVSTGLAHAGIAEPTVDAELLLAHVLGETRGRVQALALMGRRLSAEQAHAVSELASERARRVPLQHLTGRAPFREIELSVGPGVFVPRPETETVAQFAIDALHAGGVPDPIVVDLCTGSGAIALSIAHEVPQASVFAVEKSIEAHAWARRNVTEWGDGRVELLRGDVCELDGGDPWPDGDDSELRSAFAPLEGAVEVLISNPPYVPSGMVPRDPEVRDHDPALALFSGEDGLDLIRVIGRVARRLVVPGGLLVLEHAEHQGEAIRGLLTRGGWVGAATHPDLTGRDRATTAHAPA